MKTRKVNNKSIAKSGFTKHMEEKFPQLATHTKKNWRSLMPKKTYCKNPIHETPCPACLDECGEFNREVSRPKHTKECYKVDGGRSCYCDRTPNPPSEKTGEVANIKARR